MMKKMKRMKKAVSCILTAILVLALTGCGDKGDLSCSREMTQSSSNKYSEEDLETFCREIDNEFYEKYQSFAFSLFDKCYQNDKKTMMISPYSVYMAMGLLANGADGETLSEIEQAMGGLSLEEINRKASAFSNYMRMEKEDLKFIDANSIWLNKAFAKNISEDYLKACSDSFRASVFESDFSKEKARDDMNLWVKKQTLQRIPKLVDELDSEDVAILINALAFEGKWMKPFEKENVKEDTFTHADGTTDTKEMMCQIFAQADFYEDDFCRGFSLCYDDGFVYTAFLPKEGVSIDELAAHMTAENYRNLMQSETRVRLNVGIPKYEERYRMDEMQDILKEMGIQKAFSASADFSKMSKMPIYASRVVHETTIEVDLDGTTATAATEIAMTRSEAPRPEKAEEVYLNRSFLYMISASWGSAPLFIGVYR